MFSQVSVILSTREGTWSPSGGYAWFQVPSGGYWVGYVQKEAGYVQARVHPLATDTHMAGKRVVRILLECFLVV